MRWYHDMFVLWYYLFILEEKEMNEMNENFDEFDKYVMGFDFNEDMIAYKYNHSYRVMHQCDEISYTLNLDEEDNYLIFACDGIWDAIPDPQECVDIVNDLLVG